MPKVKISVAVDRDLLEWAKEQVQSMKYRNLSHVFDYALKRLKEETQDGSHHHH
jgi:Arc/MetJ-type ribon-helix-helix transcriptional regulator